MPNDIEEEVTTYRCIYCEETFDAGDGYEGDDFCSSHCYDRCHDDRNDDDDDDDSSDLPERNWGKADYSDCMSKDSGDIVKSQRIFSVEIETYYSEMREVWYVHNNTPSYVGISRDGSLNSGGVELQTPKLQGKKGEELIYKITDLLNKKDFRVDRSCGLHIHIDGKGLLPKTRTKEEPTAIKNLLMLYIAYEDVIQSILPRSRRDNNYAKHVRDNFHRSEIESCNTLESIEKLWYRVAKRAHLKNQKSQHYNSTRYNGLNLHSLFSDGHLEIRYHSGTINAEKILHWVQLHLAMVDYAKQVRYIPASPSVTNIVEKAGNLFEMLNLPKPTREYYRNRQNLFSGYQTTEETENRSY